MTCLIVPSLPAASRGGSRNSRTRGCPSRAAMRSAMLGLRGGGGTSLVVLLDHPAFLDGVASDEAGMVLDMLAEDTDAAELAKRAGSTSPG